MNYKKMRLREAFNKKTDETWKKVQTGGGRL